ncbi:lytic transglycosylase domain-containing protein [Cellulophaga omnivescoria]|uniref:lytic transglycosylase domain-containing protein n=1 Tax=Cellulophaga omnivescoria TaxID=1888890 RepID=UPI00098728D7|nr:lytic transglycosylase domain-containing protein [Cellulophaga omnivescoria]
MKRIFLGVLLFSGTAIFAQEKDSIVTTAVSTEILSVVKNDTVDTIAKKQADVPQKVQPIIALVSGDSSATKYQLSDYNNAANYDKAWLKQIKESVSLFDTIYNKIATERIENIPVSFIDLPTDTLKARLARLNAKTPFNVQYNESLERVIKSYLSRNRGLMERMLTISQFYFPMFEQELDNFNMPLEMKYLAIVESALNPRAKSRVGATGLWQFMYGTGKEQNLEVNSYVDERSDPIKSTRAACEYLTRLYSIYNDWDLALAAYNSGPGNVNKAIRRSGGYTNYWNIRNHLPRETAGYVPAFLATMYIFEYAKEHGIYGEVVDRPYFETDTVHVKSMLTFDQISRFTSVSVEELEILNPSYKLNVIPFQEDRNHALRLPTSVMGKFVTNEDAIYVLAEEELKKIEKPLPQLVKAESQSRYRVRSGDYLGKIAEKFGVRVSEIKRWNGLRGNNLRVGQRLTIFSRNSKAVVASAKPQSKQKPIPPGAKTHTVQSGDSLWTISQKYSGISVDNLKDWNGISGKNLKVGTKIMLCDCSTKKI